MDEYFRSLEKEAENCYDLAERARSMGYDPKKEVEIPRAEDLALRAQKLTGVKNTAEKIRELSEKYDREEVSIRIAKEVASRDEGSKAERLEDAVRIGLAVLTEGILVAPLEGIGGVEIRENNDGTNYAELSFAGPIRSAGGTGQAMSVLIADVVRRELGIGRFKPTPAEIQRFKEEIPLYKKSLGLQYTPSSEEISLIVDGCPVSISGEGTGQEEVSGNRDLPRVDTNQVRGGACLVIAEGMCLKAKKLKKYVDKLDIEDWEFLDEYIEKYASGKAEESEDDNDVEYKSIAPKTKYIQETIAGRPVFGHPSEKGAFRLRYGRTRTEGLASIAVNPATMYLTDEFLALGTQIKTERPGKAGAITPCDTIEGPTVLLRDGSVRRVDSPQEAKELQSETEEIIDIGEALVPFGEFVENNHPLVPGAYCHEWWKQEVEEDIEEEDVTAEKAIEFSKEKGYPLHPNYIYFWDHVQVEDVEELRDWISEEGAIEEGKLKILEISEKKEILETVGIPHEVEEGFIIIPEYRALLFTLGLDEVLEKGSVSKAEDPLEYVSDLAGVTIRSKGPTNIGSRMARPEKAKERKMSPPVHGLFPLGEAGGSERLVKKAVEENVIEVDISARRCRECGKGSAQVRCSCGGRCEIVDEPQEQKIPMKKIYRQALNTIGEGGNVDKIKGVKGLITETKTPEALEKGILRAKHDIYVFKDGTSRYDMTDLPLTHYKPEEIGLTVQKARELGYTEDIHGEELEEEDQMLELKPQDMVVSKEAGDYMVKVADFVDDLLEKYYDMESYYGAENRSDLIGELIVGLAPHTSGGVLGRIIGFHDGRAGYAHPHFHAAKRRNCDGDEDCIMLLLDGLLNFSEDFLPEKRGGLMDAPLVLTTKIDPMEIDSEAHNVDTVWEYPLEFYEKTFEYPKPKEVEDLIETVEDRLETEDQYENFGYTHETSKIDEGPTMSRYTRLGKMTEKMDSQIKVADMIRAVDTKDVVSRVINDHFIPDLIGNLNKFGVQQIRCTKCNTKYRRIPLSGKCKCGGNLTLTIHEGSVKKYLNFSLDMVEKYEVPEYLYQRVQQLNKQIESLFENDKVSNPSLDEFC
ncbi:MAG: DNA polymerase II large subunit [Thermoplasmata archaeon]